MNSNFLRMASADPRLTNSLQEAVLLLCKAGLKYDSTLSIDCLLAVTIDQKEVFIINIKESVTCSEDDCLQCLNNTGSQIESRNCRESSNGMTLKDLHRTSSPSESQTQEKCIDRSSVSSDCSAVDTMPVNMTAAWCGFIPEFSRKESGSEIDSPPLKQTEPRQRLSSAAAAAAPVISTFRREKTDGSAASKKLCLQNHDGNSMSSDQPGIELNSRAEQRFPQIKTEPLDEYRYNVPDQYSAADLHTKTGDCQGGAIDYLPFSAYAYSTQHLLQAQMAAHSQDSSTAASSNVRNSATVTLPQRQQRTLENSLCVNCGTNTTTVWRRSNEGQLLCNACGCYFKLHKVHRPLSLLRDSIQRRPRRQQVYRWTMGIPLSSTNSAPFPAR